VAFVIEREFADGMIQHAREDAPLECCGVLATKDGRIAKLIRARNAELSPYRYSIDSRELLKIYTEIEEGGFELGGIYHSHTFTEAYPSPTDVRLAGWPDALYFLISLQDPAAPDLRAFHIRDGEIQEEPLEFEA
jgi:proteasome lid subunit RPN8/RPN11